MAKLEHVPGLMRTFLVGENQTPAALCVQVQESTRRLRDIQMEMTQRLYLIARFPFHFRLERI